MKASDIRELTEKEIEARIAQLREEQFRLRFRAVTQKLDNPLMIRVVRRDIARLNTILAERRRGLEAR